jgi:hypothetical protein
MTMGEYHRCEGNSIPACSTCMLYLVDRGCHPGGLRVRKRDVMLYLETYLHRHDAPLTAVYVGSQRSPGTQSIEDSKNDAIFAAE